MVVRSSLVALLASFSLLSACGETNKNQTSSSEFVSQPETALDEGTLGLAAGEIIKFTDVKSCRVAQVDGVQLFSGNLQYAACAAKCSEYENTNPGRSCSHGGSLFRSAPTNICQIVGAGGVVKFSGQSIRRTCVQECAKFGNPGRSCLWGGTNVKQ
ncbi:MAG: hypothetical protein RL189_2745 [Pseudomonadota bacterium]